MAQVLVRNTSDPRKVSTPLDADGLEGVLRKFGIFDDWSHVITGLREGFDVGVKAETRGQKTIIEQNHGSCWTLGAASARLAPPCSRNEGGHE